MIRTIVKMILVGILLSMLHDISKSLRSLAVSNNILATPAPEDVCVMGRYDDTTKQYIDGYINKSLNAKD